MVLDKMNDDDDLHNKEMFHLYAVFLKVLDHNNCVTKFITLEHIMDKIMNDIKNINKFTP